MNETAAPTASEACAQCGKALTADDRVPAGDRVFCHACYTSLRAELEQAVTAVTSNINYVNATLGALLGGVAGVLLWWGFTAVTHLALGLIAIAIGFLVGWGTVRFSGGKHSHGLQALSIGVALLSYLCATYLVNMTFLNKAFAEQGDPRRLGFPPASLEQFVAVVRMDFGIMDLVFLAIVIYEAWKIPKPPVLPPAAA
jgi:hypothetical protein